MRAEEDDDGVACKRVLIRRSVFQTSLPLRDWSVKERGLPRARIVDSQVLLSLFCLLCTLLMTDEIGTNGKGRGPMITRFEVRSPLAAVAFVFLIIIDYRFRVIS